MRTPTVGGDDDVNDADCLSLDPVMSWIVGGHAVTKQAASSSQMRCFEMEVLATEEIGAQEKATGEVCLDDDKSGRMDFRTRSNHQHWTVGRLRRESCSDGGAIWV